MSTPSAARITRAVEDTAKMSPDELAALTNCRSTAVTGAAAAYLLDLRDEVLHYLQMVADGTATYTTHPDTGSIRAVVPTGRAMWDTFAALDAWRYPPVELEETLEATASACVATVGDLVWVALVEDAARA